MNTIRNKNNIQITEDELKSLQSFIAEFFRYSSEDYGKNLAFFKSQATKLNENLSTLNIQFDSLTIDNLINETHHSIRYKARFNLNFFKINNPHTKVILNLTPLNVLFKQNIFLSNSFLNPDFFPTIYDINPDFFKKHIEHHYYETLGKFTISNPTELDKKIDHNKINIRTFFRNSFSKNISIDHWIQHPLFKDFITKTINVKTLNDELQTELLNISISEGDLPSFNKMFFELNFKLNPTIDVLADFASRQHKKTNFIEFLNVLLHENQYNLNENLVILKAAISLGHVDTCIEFLEHPTLKNQKNIYDTINFINEIDSKNNIKKENLLNSTKQNASTLATKLFKIETKERTIKEIQPILKKIKLYYEISDNLNTKTSSQTIKNKI